MTQISDERAAFLKQFAEQPAPPSNPFYRPPPTELEPDEEIATETTKLDEGLVRMVLPDKLSPASVEELEYWLHGVLRRACRRAGIDPDPAKRQKPSAQ